jgi:endonuclease YncB( thermonuclease family)
MQISTGRTAIAAICAAVTLLLLQPAAFAATSCSAADGESAPVTGIDERAEPVLADGRVVLLPDVQIPQDRERSAPLHVRQALSAQLIGGEVRLARVDARPDRWGRLVARLYARDRAQPQRWVWIEQELVEAGLARVAPQFDPQECDVLLLASEARARAATLGLWRDPFYSPISAARPDRLSDHVGELTLVEGRIVSLGEAGALTYLNFGKDRRRDLALVASKSRRRAFAASGVQLASYVGRFVRARGDLEFRFEPRIEIYSPAQVELIDPIGASEPLDGVGKND